MYCYNFLLLAFLLVVSFYRNIKYCILFFGLICVAKFFSLFVHPSPDNIVFISAAQSYENLRSAIFDTSDNIAPVSPFIRLFVNLFNLKYQNAALLVNSLFLYLASLNCIMFIYELKFHLKHIIINYCILFLLFPMSILILVTASKDFCIAFILSEIFLSFYLMSLTYFGSLRYFFQIIKVLFLLNCLAQVRHYFLNIIILALVISLFYKMLKSIKIKELGLFFLCLSVLFILSLIIHFDWAQIRRIIFTYNGNSTILPLYNLTDNFSIGIIFYPLYILINLFLYPFLMTFFNPNMNLYLQLLSFLEGASFLFGFLIFLKYFVNDSLFVSKFIIFFFIIHFVIQPLGSPNVGSLFRLTIFEALIFTTLFSRLILPKRLQEYSKVQ